MIGTSAGEGGFNKKKSEPPTPKRIHDLMEMGDPAPQVDACREIEEFLAMEEKPNESRESGEGAGLAQAMSGSDALSDSTSLSQSASSSALSPTINNLSLLLPPSKIEDDKSGKDTLNQEENKEEEEERGCLREEKNETRENGALITNDTGRTGTGDINDAKLGTTCEGKEVQYTVPTRKEQGREDGERVYEQEKVENQRKKERGGEEEYEEKKQKDEDEENEKVKVIMEEEIEKQVKIEEKEGNGEKIMSDSLLNTDVGNAETVVEGTTTNIVDVDRVETESEATQNIPTTEANLEAIAPGEKRSINDGKVEEGTAVNSRSVVLVGGRKAVEVKRESLRGDSGGEKRGSSYGPCGGEIPLGEPPKKRDSRKRGE